MCLISFKGQIYFNRWVLHQKRQIPQSQRNGVTYTNTILVSGSPRDVRSKFVKSSYQNIQLSIQHGVRTKH